MKLDLIGNVSLSTRDGDYIDLPGPHAKALFAILGTSRKMERSRVVLRDMLWSRVPEHQGSASLRTLLSTIRKALGGKSEVIQADRHRVWLEYIEVNDASDGRTGFFEDAPDNLGEPFEDWLRLERSRVSNATSNKLALEPQHKDTRVLVTFLPPIVHSADGSVDILANWITHHLIQHMCLFDMVDVLDYSTLSPQGSAAVSQFCHHDPDVAIQLQASQLGTVAELGVRAYDPTSRRVLWGASMTADQTTTFQIRSPQIEGFINQTVDLIHNAILESIETGKIRPGKKPISMMGAVHQILGHTVDGQIAARAFLDSLMEEDRSSTAAAWMAFSVANTLGESGDPIQTKELATEYCRRALEIDPGNGLALALIGHVQGFVFRRLNLGAECLELARKCAPALPLAWDLSAMNALYCGNTQSAVEYSTRAVELGRYSPYKPLYQSSQAISAALNGEHKRAVAASAAVLDQMPDFLAVKRHMCGSLAALGRFSESQTVVNEIRERDPRFGPEALRDPSYPLPSKQSIDLIRHGFERLNLIT